MSTGRNGSVKVERQCGAAEKCGEHRSRSNIAARVSIHVLLVRHTKHTRNSIKHKRFLCSPPLPLLPVSVRHTLASAAAANVFNYNSPACVRLIHFSHFRSSKTTISQRLAFRRRRHLYISRTIEFCCTTDIARPAFDSISNVINLSEAEGGGREEVCAVSRSRKFIESGVECSSRFDFNLDRGYDSLVLLGSTERPAAHYRTAASAGCNRPSSANRPPSHPWVSGRSGRPAPALGRQMTRFESNLRCSRSVSRPGTRLSGRSRCVRALDHASATLALA